MGFSLGSVVKSAASWVGDKVDEAAQGVAADVSHAVDAGGKALQDAQHWVGDRLDDVDHAKDWVGGKIDGAVQGAEHAVDDFRHGLVDFGEQHGGFVGKALAENVSNTVGLVEGAGLAVYDMGKGVVQLADGAGKLVNPLEWATHGERNLQRLETVGKAGVALGNLTNPAAWLTNTEGNANTAKALWDGVTGGYQDAAKQGDWSKFIGRGVVDVGSLFIGVGEANAAIKGAEGANAVAKLGEGVNALDKVADGARALDAAADAGKAARVADGADAAKAADATTDVLKLRASADAVTLRKIESCSTFVTHGLDNAAAEAFLGTPSGKDMMRVMSAADPGADATTIYTRAMQTLATGSNVPEVKVVSDALVKVVPQGEKLSAYSPFFATPADLEAAAKSGKSLADMFGLPIKSEAATYDVYRITPKDPATVFVQTIAPTSELGGAVTREGGALQYLVLDRSLWSDAVKIGSMPN